MAEKKYNSKNMSRQYDKNTKFQRTVNNQKYSKKIQSYFVLQRRILLITLVLATVIFLLTILFSPIRFQITLIIYIVVIFILSTAYISAYIKEKRLKFSIFNRNSLDSLYHMNPFDFEELVANLFKKMGYSEVSTTTNSHDGGVDIVMNKDGVSYGVQCKKYTPDSYIKIEFIKALLQSCDRLKIDNAIFVTTANFSDYTIKYMKNEKILLIDGRELLRLISIH